MFGKTRALVSTAAIMLVVAGVPMTAAAQSQHGPQQQQHQQRDDRQSDRQSDRNREQSRPGDNRPQAQSSGRYRIVSTVNLRSGPGTNHRRVGQLRAGRVVEVDQVRSGWLHVRGQGWISAQFARRA